MQDDNLQPLLTVQEAMSIAADLKMTSTYSERDKKAKVILTTVFSLLT